MFSWCAGNRSGDRNDSLRNLSELWLPMPKRARRKGSGISHPPQTSAGAQKPPGHQFQHELRCVRDERQLHQNLSASAWKPAAFP